MRPPCMAALVAGLLSIVPPTAAQAQHTPPPPRDAGHLGAALDAARADDWRRARAIADRASPVVRTIIDWRALRSGEGGLDDYRAFLAAHAHWPRAGALRDRAEALLADRPAAEIAGAFASRAPRTARGWLALALAQAELGNRAAARGNAVKLWRTAPLPQGDEAALLAAFPRALADHHADRVDMLLWEGQTAAAARHLDRLGPGQAALARARIALQERRGGVDALVAAVPEALRSTPGLAHDRFVFRYRVVSRETAGDLLITQSRAAQGLGRPEAWAWRRLALVRGALADGRAARAYRLATPHGLRDGLAFVNLAFLAGFIALEYLDRPADALDHFRALRVRVSSPISLGRAGYWEGRAQMALDAPLSAQAAFAFAAEHQTSYYGQLAAERLGRRLDPALVDGAVHPHWRDTPLAQSDLLRAGQLLYRAGEWYEARRFFMQQARQLDAPDQLGALADLMLALDEPNFALKVAKIAVRKGVVLPRAYFPLVPLDEDALRAPPALVSAVARRESEFDPRAVSGADARGLMQLLPGTGRMMARKLGVAYRAADLTRDPELNMRLGAAYLEELRDEFGPSLGLVAAGYNAGPGRPRRWIGQIGDPRARSVDFVTWVERVPFAETRNYIMRVAEAVVVYRSRLAGEARPIALEALIRGQ